MTEQNLLRKKQNHQDEEFDTINSSVSEKLLTPSIVKEGFTVIKGIGPSVAKKLTEAKIESIEKLAHLSPNTLASSINGIGVASAQKIINGAMKHLSLKKLNDFSPSTEDDDNNEIESSKLEVYKETKDDEIKSHSKDLKGPQGRSNRWFEDKFKKLKTETWYPPANLAPEVEIMAEELLEDEELIEIKDIDREQLKLTRLESVRNFLESDTDVPPIESIQRPKVDEISIPLDEPADFKESMNHEQINNLKDNITTILESGEFHIITRIPSLKPVFMGIDLLALKLINVDDFLELICIIPIKICSLKGPLIVSEEDISYHPLENNETNIHLDKIPRSNAKILQNIKNSIFTNIVDEGSLFDYLNNQLKINISIEKTITQKALFLRSGPIQYRLLVEPLIISQNTVGFTEKILPFAYQKSTNIHVIDISQLSGLLQYFDQKYFCIEKYSQVKSPLSLKLEAEHSFWKELGRISIPFITIPLIYILVFLFQSYSFLRFFNNLAFGLGALYGIIFGYIYLKRYKQEVEIYHNFKTPYYQKDHNLDETSSILINSELTPSLMEQFAYECLGNHNNSKLMAKVEHDNAKQFLTNKIMKKKVKEVELFEKDLELTKNAANPAEHNEFSKRYSSFLED